MEIVCFPHKIACSCLFTPKFELSGEYCSKEYWFDLSGVFHEKVLVKVQGEFEIG